MATSNSAERRAAYMRGYRKAHPEYTQKEWERSAVSRLRKLGYTLIAPGEESIKEYVEKLFDGDRIGEQILAEALFRAKQQIDMRSALMEDGYEVLGTVSINPDALRGGQD